jgi:hypothetical protein
MVELSFDFRLLDVSIELHALEDHLEIIEDHIKQLVKLEYAKVDDLVKANHWEQDDADWDFARQECNHRIGFLFPRIFRGPFLVALYAVFEAAITEISRLIQSKQSQPISMNDLRGEFLERASKYYKNIIKFDLHSNKEWQRIKILSELRNAIAHTNGRMDMLKNDTRTKIHQWEKQNIGIYSDLNFLIVDEKFASEIYRDVRLYLDDLVSRYKEWDTNSGSQPKAQKSL